MLFVSSASKPVGPGRQEAVVLPEMLTSPQHSCRICRESTGRLVGPCACDGSIKYVHSKCLVNWVFYKRSLSCEVCGATYSVAKVLDSRKIDKGGRNVLALVWRHACCHARHAFRTVVSMLFSARVTLFVSLMYGTLHGLKNSPSFTNSVTPGVVSGVLHVLHYESGIYMCLGMAHTYTLWEIWNEWYVLNIPRNAPDVAEPVGRVGLPPHALPVDNPEDEELDLENMRNYVLEPAALPEESATVLHAIMQTKRRGSRSSEETIISSIQMKNSAPLVMYYLFVWLAIACFPAIVDSVVVALWEMVGGGSRCREALKAFIIEKSMSEGLANMRYLMLQKFVDALRSSTVLLLSTQHMKRLFLMGALIFVAKRRRDMPCFRKLLSILVYLRGSLNIYMLLTWVLPTFCFLSTALFTNFFELGGPFDCADSAQAWRLINAFGSTRGERGSMHHLNFMVGTEVPHPAAVFKALSVITNSKSTDKCRNLGGVGGQRKSGSLLNGEWWVLDDHEVDDPVTLQLFAASVVVSKLDTFTLLAAGHVMAFLVVLQLCHMRLFTAALPINWARYSLLCKIFQSSVFEAICLFDTSTLIRLYVELVALLIVILCAFLWKVFAVSRALLPSVVPMVLGHTNNYTLVSWLVMIVVACIHTLPAVYMKFLKRSVVGPIGELLDIRETTQRRPVSSIQLLSRVLRRATFVMCGYLLSILLTAIVAVPALHVILTHITFITQLYTIQFSLHMFIQRTYPGGLLIAAPQIYSSFQQLPSRLLFCWRRWWIASCLGINVKQIHADNRGTVTYRAFVFKGLPADLLDAFATQLDVIRQQIADGALPGTDEAELAARMSLLPNPNATPRQPALELRERDLAILCKHLQWPSCLRCLSFLAILLLTFVFLPLMMGMCVSSLVRGALMPPHCLIAPPFIVAMTSWSCGLAVVIALAWKNAQITQLLERAVRYFSVGCHHLPARRALQFVVTPLLMKFAPFTIVPHALACTVLPFVMELRENNSGMKAPVIVAMLLFVLWNKGHIQASMAPWIHRISGGLRRAVVLQRGHVENVITRAPLPSSETETENAIPGVWGNAGMDVSVPHPATHATDMRLRTKPFGRLLAFGSFLRRTYARVLGRCCTIMYSVTGNITQLLNKMLERESIVGVVFTDRH
ncbi:RING variant domain [Trypanosoma vivax]|nr:RING variant domain [Trypanosoma vivax]